MEIIKYHTDTNSYWHGESLILNIDEYLKVLYERGLTFIIEEH